MYLLTMMPQIWYNIRSKSVRR
ncbi:MAG: hypothetical protein IJX19_04680 [Clostridia bacterium]|nr:hypothetical protein [Clostridia bacterium]